MEVQQIEEKLKTALKPSRYRHTLGVAYTASCMAAGPGGWRYAGTPYADV